MLKLLCQTFARLNTFLTHYFVDFFWFVRFIRRYHNMSADGSGMDVTNGGNECNVFHRVDFAHAPHSWAHMFKAGLTSSESALPMAEYVVLQWFYPVNFGLDGVAIPGDEEFRDVKFVRQDPKGFLILVLFKCTTSQELL